MSAPTLAAITIRPRQPTDLASCASLLARVYAKDRYPVQGVSHAVEFLSSPDTLASWVAVAELETTPAAESTAGEDQLENKDADGSETELPRILAHVSLTSPPTTSADPAVALWRSQSANPAPIAVLERLFVDQSARGQGLAERLMRTVGEAAGNRGLRCVLFALVKDVGAMRLYERVGWREFGRDIYDYEDGEGVKSRMEAVCFVGPDTTAGTGTESREAVE